jgi:hypothetical protein
MAFIAPPEAASSSTSSSSSSSSGWFFPRVVAILALSMSALFGLAQFFFALRVAFLLALQSFLSNLVHLRTIRNGASKRIGAS